MMSMQHRNVVPVVLAVGLLVIYGTLQFYCVTHPAPTIDLVSARVQDIFIMIISYYFGNSHQHSAETIATNKS